jgi:hypothetical protein
VIARPPPDGFERMTEIDPLREDSRGLRTAADAPRIWRAYVQCFLFSI